MFEFRLRAEHCRPGGWWRRDLMLKLLEATWPMWLPARAFPPLFFRVTKDPREKKWRQRLNTIRVLTRLHEYGDVDRYGEPVKMKGRLPGKRDGDPYDFSTGWLVGDGYRYRLRKRPEDFL